MFTRSFHLVDTKGEYQGTRCLTDEQVTKLEESGYHLVPVGNAHLAIQTIDEIVRGQHAHG